MGAVAIETAVTLMYASIGAAGNMGFIMWHPAAIHYHVASSAPITHRKGRAVIRKACTCAISRILRHLDACIFTSLHSVFGTKELHDLGCVVVVAVAVCVNWWSVVVIGTGSMQEILQDKDTVNMHGRFLRVGYGHRVVDAERSAAVNVVRARENMYRCCKRWHNWHNKLSR